MKEVASIPLPALSPSVSAHKQPEIDVTRAQDGAQLHLRYWRGRVGKPVVVYLHGIEGHGQWFENTASYLNSREMSVYAADRRGSGANQRDRGHLPSYRAYLADTEILLRRVAAQHPAQAIVLMGNCWGAKAATLLACDKYRGVDGPFNVKLAGLILTCPAIYTKVDFDRETKLRIALNCIRGDRWPMTTVPVPLTISMFTDNKTYIDFIEKDPLRLTEATSKFYFETFIMGLLAQRAASSISMPTLIIQSGGDQIVDLEGLQGWYDRLKAVDKQLRIFPDAQHSIDFDPVWFSDYTTLLSEWLLSRTVPA